MAQIFFGNKTIFCREEQPYDPSKLSGQNGFLLLNHYRSALMGFAALWIYVSHVWLTVFDGHLRILWVETFIKNLGFCGVDIFLFFSGIGLTYSIGKSKNVFFFYGKRLKRIMPPFFVVALLNSYTKGWSPAHFWQNVLCISFYRTSVYAILWFVPAILTLYLFFPLYYRLFTKSSGKIRFTLCALAIWLICSLFAANRMRYDLFGFTDRIPIFIIGILIGWLSQKGNPVFEKLTWKLLGLIFLLGLYLSYLSIYQDMYILVPASNCCFPNMLISGSLSFLLARFLFTINEKPYIRFFGKGLTRVLSFFGAISLEFYCIQEWMAEQILFRILGRCSDLTVNIILLSITTIAALALHHTFKYLWILVEQAAKRLTVKKGNR